MRVSTFALGALMVSAVPAFAQDDLVTRGEYLARAGDCTACHTATGGAYMAGGYPFEMPMGTIISSNITPSDQYGIGKWTEAEFADALRKGVRPDGSRLYPAMPYPSYANITDEDIAALYAYFMQIDPVDAAPKVETALDFPFNIPGAMAAWDLLFAGGDPYTADPELTDQQNRGAYLVKGLAHCSTCHTPRNQLMATDNTRFLAGTAVEGWYAPNLTSDDISGLGQWSDAEIASYLQNGHAMGKAQAGGPMADAVQNSLQYLTDQDIAAITAYLRTVPAIRDQGQDTPAWSVTKATPADWTQIEPGMVASDQPGYIAADMTDGAQLYNVACAACHGMTGQGSEDGTFPPLTGNSAVGSANHNNLVMAIVQGIHRTGADGTAVMPAFGEGQSMIHGALDNSQIAAVSNYVTASFGKGDAGLTGDDVSDIMAADSAPWLIEHAKVLFWAGVALAGIVVIALIAWALRRKRTV
ncbi:c-type cytochrome [Donghicola sp. C2-DW-16]|uniref:C-type cytochrome n=1 Tax=Donghicola mangrovi TaxID=2729614 RepID=A0ABX2PCY1_9RHOB|nr:cytochrome c [Donghicola mangrovi]NVO27228.1 c-type cytochrome [Donghicola mangrovi]